MKEVKTMNFMVAAGILVALTIPLSFAVYRKETYALGNMNSSIWNVTLDQNDVNNYLSIIPEPTGTTASYTLNITNNSQVDAIYSIEVEDLPSGVSVKLDNGSFVPESSNKVIFTDVDIIHYNDANKTKTHTLTFKASSTTAYVAEKEVNINVVMRQDLSI